MARKIAAVVFSLGCLQAESALALGLGELELESFLNQPLNASVDLLNMGGLHQDEVKVRLGTREDFDKLGLDRAYFLTSIQFEVVTDDDGTARIVMTSDAPVLEPYLDFVVEARWPSGRLLREYTVLVDPPAFAEAATVVSASERVAVIENIPAPEKKSVTEGSSTGTQVELRRSDLAPGQMPQRGYNSSTAASPTAGSRYMVARDQTLWDIASQAKPAGASVYQTMLDIQRLNPNAFINGNINRVKAGYIVYLPTSDDISSGDVSQAQAEVREQNAAWREGRDAEAYASSGPSLSISADDSVDDTAAANTEGAPATGAASDDQAATSDDTSGAGVDSDLAVTGESQEQLAAMEHQLKTLERIITLKDEQIAALQGALAEGDDTTAGTDLDSDTLAGDTEIGVAEAFVGGSEIENTGLDAQDGEPTTDTEEVDQTPVTASAEPVDSKPIAAAKPAPAAKSAALKPESSGGWMDYLWYILGAVVLGIIALVVVGRRRGDDDDEPTPHSAGGDVFSDVKLKEQQLEVDAQDSEEEAGEPEPEPDRNRGYGERRHDEYASDVDAADALAEADIYIAYGRHPQAIDLLNNALANEPGNPVYRLKLLEIHTELNNVGAATAQLEKIREIGDPDSIARAEALMEGVGGAVEDAVPAATPAAVSTKAVDNGPGLTPNPLDLSTGSDVDLEADFSGLEIEGAGSESDDLDLSGDFAKGSGDDADEEELVIAADSNGLSTKLDLARAYLDMGDDEGARQILDEVVAEGSDELKAEARTLLNRIGG